MDAGPEGTGTGQGEAGLVEAVRSLTRALAGARVSGIDDAGLLGLVEGLELLARAAGAASARAQVAFGDSQVAAQARDGVPASRRGRAVADDLATARRTSPYWAGRELTAARALIAEMPCTLAALAAGTISPVQARLVTEATTCLQPGDRAQVDSRLAGSLEGASTKQIVAAARALAYEVDPAGFVGRARAAAAERGVSVRPAPDVMGLLSARLPAPQAIATHQVLRAHAEGARAAGDPRTLNQLMADELFARVTGRSVVDGIDVEIGLVLTDATLLAGDPAAADLTGYGPLPADLARDLLQPTDPQDTQDDPDQSGEETLEDPGPAQEPCPAGGRCTDARCTAVHGGTPPGPPPPTLPTRSPDRPGPAPTAPPPDPAVARAAKVWLRRLYTDPTTGTLTVRDPRRRAFTGNLRATLIARGRYCASPWCGAPIRHLDHITRYRHGGTTTTENARGLCARCNLAREHPRHADPPPQSYQDPPPLLDTFHGRPPTTAPPPRTDTTDDNADDPLRHTA